MKPPVTIFSPIDDVVSSLQARMAEVEQQLGAFDKRTATIIACHFALERALERSLDALLPRSSFLRRLGYGQKVAVLQAAGDPDWTDRVAKALLAMNDLRNEAAHPGPGIDTLISKFLTATAEIPTHEGALDPAPMSIEFATQMVVAALHMLELGPRGQSAFDDIQLPE